MTVTKGTKEKQELDVKETMKKLEEAIFNEIRPKQDKMEAIRK